ncbi:MAG: ABC transporter permease [Myxococcota bacterium]|nr:ABC transporter permease [Myxococcota bacterium]
MTTAELDLSRPEEGVLLLRLAGSWNMAGEIPPPDRVRAEFEAAQPARLRFDTSGLGDWDTALLTFVRRVLVDCTARNVAADREGLPESVRRLMALAEAVPEKKDTGRSGSRASFLVRVGETAEKLREGAQDFLAFLGESTLAFGRLLRGRATFPRVEFAAVLQQVGADALPIVSLISLLVGLILAFMGAIQLKQFGAEIYVANLVGIGMARDMGAIMAGIIMAGRTGAAFAAQLGTMTVNEEIDALETMGIDPMEYLVLPRMLALMLMMPLLTLYADFLGIVGGMLVSTTALGVGAVQYAQQTIAAISLGDFGAGVFKGAVYGVIVALSGCLRGMQCGRSAAAVGDATTSAVVTGITFIIVACGLLTVLYDQLGI